MYIFNITFVVEPTADEAWSARLHSDFLPNLGGRKTVLCRVLSEHHEGHFTYSLQVECDTMDDYKELKQSVDTVWGESCKTLFGEQVLHFDTLMKKI